MGSNTRRSFLLHVAATGSAIVALPALAAPASLDPKDPQAVALGYVADTTHADAKKYPKHTAAQKCSGCQLYGGAAGAATGPCPIYAGKLVSANGWCSSWIKKAG
jgi:hypothetical protein